jgi:hypothetical protein
MKITKRQLKRIIKEERARLQEANPSYPKHMFPERDPSSRTESGDPQSYKDFAERLDALARMAEDLSMDYVDSDWLGDGDHGSLAADVEKLFETSDRLSMAAMGLAQSMGEI